MDEMEIEVPIDLPVDHDNFLRRECPHCERQFKWHNGPANAEAEHIPAPETYYCPLCGQPAGPDSWWTREQLDYAEQAAMPTALQVMDDEIGQMLKGLSSKHVKVSRTGHLDVPDGPLPLIEPDDMVIVASPCHSYEPIKVPERERGPFHCLVCGTAFAV